jgi:hypothetical protein
VIVSGKNVLSGSGPGSFDGKLIQAYWFLIAAHHSGSNDHSMLIIALVGR